MTRKLQSESLISIVEYVQDRPQVVITETSFPSANCHGNLSF